MFQEIYVPWTPRYTTTTRNVTHPSPVYESVHMASVSPPLLNIQLCVNTSHNNTCQHNISDVQVEAIAYAMNAFDDANNINNYTRGFFLGDGTGVGKSRILAGILSELWMRNNTNFRAIWVSINKNLENNAKR